VFGYFTKPIDTVETAPRRSLPEDLHTAQAELAAAKRELAEAQRAVQAYRGTHQDLRVAVFNGEPAICLNASQMHPHLRSLEHELREKVQKFNAAASEFAEAKRATGLGSY
jgi:hypothetical protein